MNSAPFFSIVVSACNIAPYAEKMIGSIKKQTDADFEVLIAAEESTDNTVEILLKVIGPDVRFRVERLPRTGSASAGRNWGMEHASGRYLLFLDGDDWLCGGALSAFRVAIEKFGEIDIIAGQNETILEVSDQKKNVKIYTGHAIECNQVFPAAEAFARILRNRFLPAVWHQIYRTAFLRDDPSLRQCVGRRHQDVEWTPRVFLAAKTFLAIPDIFYVYRKRENSVTTKSNPKSMTDITDNLLSCFQYWRAHDIPPVLRSELANWQVDALFRFFSPRSIRLYSRELRCKCFQRLMARPEDFKTYQELASAAHFSKKILIPLMGLARNPRYFHGCEWVFNHIYWTFFYTLWGNLKNKLRPKHRRL